MAIYTVYAPRRVAAPEAEPMALAFIKEGFNWPALFFPLIWLVVRRLWLVLLLYVVAFAVIGALGRALAEDAVFFDFSSPSPSCLRSRRTTCADGRSGARAGGWSASSKAATCSRRSGAISAGFSPANLLAPGEAPDLPPPPRIAPTFTSDHSTPVVGLFPQGQSG